MRNDVSFRVTGRAATLGLATLVLAANGASARPRGEIVEFGQTTGDRSAAPIPGFGGTGLAPALPMTRTSYLDHSDTVEGRLCRSFGMTVRVRSDPADVLPDTVLVEVRHPRFTTPDGATSVEDDFPSAIVDGTTHVGFSFDQPWELRPGEWTVAVRVGPTEIAAKRFTVTLPMRGRSRSDCDLVQS